MHDALQAATHCLIAQPHVSWCHAGCKHFSTTVEAGKTYLFRIINAGTLTYQTLCFEVRFLISQQHTLAMLLCKWLRSYGARAFKGSFCVHS